MFLQGIVVSLFFFCILFALTYSIVFWFNLGGNLSIIATALILIFTLFISFGLMYVFPLMARFNNTISRTIKNAFLVSLANMKATLLLLLIHIFVISLIYLFPAFKIFMLLIGFSFTAYVNSWILTKVFKNYEPNEAQPVQQF